MREKVVNWLTGIVIGLTVLQSMVPQIVSLVHNELFSTILSASIMFLVSALTNWKQALSCEIDNKALWPTRIVAAIAIVGAFNQWFEVIPFSPMVAQVLRLVITFTTMCLNLISKVKWPTSDTKSII